MFATKWLSVQLFLCEHDIVLIQIKILDKSEKMDSEEDKL